MSIDSALIVKREKLPSSAELAAAIAETGVVVTFPEGFDLGRTPKDWVTVSVDGETTGFGYAVDAVADLEEPLPAKARRYGDTLLSFGAKSGLSAETVSLIQRVMGARWGAAAWIEEELITPKDLASEFTPPEDMDPDLAATMTGTPAERAAATQRYIEKFYPPVPRDRKAEAVNQIRPLVIPILVLLLLGGLYLWSRFQ
ncbi:MAG: hypothetical protein HZY74_00335 [Brevundimonas sp.]|nr:MAG: hypothetical protein HZY74_00335 [Brevundimonas sp.]